MKPKAYSYIRFSTSEQEMGDSYNRQIEESNAVAKKYGLTLDETLTDRGLSALTGAHRKKGKLKVFLEMIENAEIPKGSLLIVENLDRLSREPGFYAMKQLTDILHAEVKIIISQDIDNIKELSRETINNNPYLLGEISGEITRANRESARKQDTLSKAWKNKRKRIKDGTKLSSKCPAWLIPVYSKPGINGKIYVKDYMAIEEASRVINLIYDMYLDGKGKERIAKELNQPGLNLWKPPARKNKKTGEYRKSIWKPSYISKLLHEDRRLLGEFEPRVKENGKYVKTGEVFPNYYPIIIDRKKYEKAQSRIKHNAKKAGNSGGKNGKIHNLFSPLAICANCGSPMKHQNKGNKSGGRFFRCSNSVNDLGCKSPGKKYKIIEDTILLYCHGLEVKDLLVSDKKRISRISKLNELKQEINHEILKRRDEIKNIENKVKEASTSSFTKMLEKSFLLLTSKIDDLKSNLDPIIDELNLLKNEEIDTEQELKDVKELIEKMSQMKGKELIDFRIKLRNHLRQLIRQIKFYEEQAWIFFKTGRRRMVRYDDSPEHYKYWDFISPKDVKLAKKGKLPDEVGDEMIRTRFPKKV